MFNGEEFTSFASDLPAPQVEEKVRDALGHLGNVEFISKSDFKISTTKLSNFTADVHIDGNVRKKKDGNEHTVTISYRVVPTVATWLIAILGFLFCLIGPLIFIFPIMAKGDVQRKVERSLQEIKSEFE